MQQATQTPRPWRMVGFLAAFYALSILDRLIILQLVDPLSRDLGLTDAGLGILYGFGFGVVYSIMAIPLAHMVDTRKRTTIVAIAVGLWSISTALSALANSLEMLILFRVGVAVGEAALIPAAISLIGDSFTARRRTLAMAWFSAFGLLMTPGAFIVGGAIVALASEIAPSLAMSSWQLTFVMVGLPGIVAAPLFFLMIREPARTGGDGTAGGTTYSIEAAITYLRRSYRFWGSAFLAMCFTYTAAAAWLTWTSVILVRVYGIEPPEAAIIFGAAGVCGALVGIPFWSWLKNAQLSRSDHWGLQTLTIACLTFLVAGTCVSMTMGLGITIAFIAIGMFAFTGISIIPNLLIQDLAPSGMRGRLAAGNQLASGLVGNGIGPVLVAVLADRLLAPPASVADGLTVVAVAAIPAFAAAIALAYLNFRNFERQAFIDA